MSWPIGQLIHKCVSGCEASALCISLLYNRGMNWLFSAVEELLPVIAFFVAQQWYSFQTGIIVMLAVVAALLLASWSFGRAVPRFAVGSSIALLVFSIPSIVTGNTTYFQISDTILDALFAALLLGSWSFRFLILKYFFERVFAISDDAWQILALRWGLMLALMAVLNEFFRVGYSQDVWAVFKLISTIFILLFGCYQFTLSARMRIPEESNRLGLRV